MTLETVLLPKTYVFLIYLFSFIWGGELVGDQGEGIVSHLKQHS